jgi:hypothetical protein
MQEIWGVWCKRVQFSTMSELKQIRILNLKALIATSLPLESKKQIYSSNWCIHQVFNHSKQTNNGENMMLELERGLELFFLKIWKQTITHPVFLGSGLTCPSRHGFFTHRSNENRNSFVCHLNQAQTSLALSWTCAGILSFLFLYKSLR